MRDRGLVDAGRPQDRELVIERSRANRFGENLIGQMAREVFALVEAAQPATIRMLPPGWEIAVAKAVFLDISVDIAKENAAQAELIAHACRKQRHAAFLRDRGDARQRFGRNERDVSEADQRDSIGG